MTRRVTATAAAEMATVSGLDSISMTKLAKATGYSASGILTVYKNREAIQVAAVDLAREVFIAEVVTPAWGTTPGLDRLGSLIQNWFDYVAKEIFPGGCFLVATSVEYGTQKGVVAEAVRRSKRDWIGVIEGELRVDRSASKKSDALVSETAFKLDAYMSNANIRYQLSGDKADMALGRKLCRDLLHALA